MIKRVIGPILQKFWKTSFSLNVFEIAMHMLYWYLDLQATLKVYWILEIDFLKWFCLQNTKHATKDKNEVQSKMETIISTVFTVRRHQSHYIGSQQQGSKDFSAIHATDKCD